MTAVVIILALCVPLSTAIAGFLAFKGVQLGLRWRIETDRDQVPTMEPTLPQLVKPPEPTPAGLTPDLISEWLNGPKEDDRNEGRDRGPD
ncbi:hypothetical protein [Gorillibacterium timonense]|uniref:hypothetical protein n=1 Tax=Gorillibacterium timonense TaxID=1689269 RepID=UPI00071E3719|nr:hypothetical protein [Gorillibacterium timonense]